MARARLAVGALLLAGGALLVVLPAAAPPPAATSAQPVAETAPGAPAAPGRVPPAAEPASSAPVPSAVGSAAASTPLRLQIPVLGLDAAVLSVGVQPDNTIEVPQPGPDYDLPAWYRHSPAPGDLGPAVILGHVDGDDGRPSVFAGLGTLQPGDDVWVTRGSGEIVRFRVTAVANFPRARFPTDLVYGNLDYPGLRLITCSGGIDPVDGRYRDNTVVFARVTAALD